MVVKKSKPIRVQMYFGADDVSMEVFRELEEVSKATGMSMSQIVYACFVSGFYDYKLRETFMKFQRPKVKRLVKKDAK